MNSNKKKNIIFVEIHWKVPFIKKFMDVIFGAVNVGKLDIKVK